MIYLVYVGGLMVAAYALIRLWLWKYVSWGSEFNRLTNMHIGYLVALNRWMPFIAAAFAFMCFVFPVFLTTTVIGNILMVLASLSFTERGLEQLVHMETNPNVSLAILLLSILGGVVFLLPIIFR